MAAAAVERASAGPKATPMNGVAIANTVRRILGVPLQNEAEQAARGRDSAQDDPILRRVESAVKEFMPGNN